MTELIVEDLISTRLDRFIRRKFSYLTQGIIEKNLRKGKITLNGKIAKSSDRVINGDIVIIADYLINEVNSDLPDSPKTYFSPAVISLANKILTEYLIFSCDEFIAINKPYGIAVQGGSKINISIDHALSYLNETNNNTYRLVHRLDKATSGVLLIAKNLNSSILLGKAFRDKEIKKTYLAIVVGNMSLIPKEGIIESYIGKEKSGTHEVVKETQNGKFAKTLYEILASNEDISALKFSPLTGRMHQLRFHSKQLGFPILGDVKYGGPHFDRMMLHALKLVIPFSTFNQTNEFQGETAQRIGIREYSRVLQNSFGSLEGGNDR